MNGTIRRIMTIGHYVLVLCEYVIIIFLAFLLNSVLDVPHISGLPLQVSGSIVVVFGSVLTIWSCLLQCVKGKGTTAFSEPATKLVVSGPYRIVRNPMMIGLFIFFAGFGIVCDLVAMFLILPILMIAIHLFTIYIEEPGLKRRFGREWTDYTKKVPRWLPFSGKNSLK
jgi:protein-S-isoprenylcysteine O-methyltransferase Ste14